ncbi:S-layer homology domain-containing protein [Defluviitalea raffinosedens]|uniref:SLH domain-containing protein n=1 Tax=Defluviitalea raffinosedens TaxID=1450156 RepID=A0A7C8HIU5_9FIRM|nr:S-layer homology domain-containing protein [Defluviitalea raffinosedens]KAE9636187.1 hypothetical protein GND95_03430 [Defluviitalea raffinosedens]MBM7684957.1 hypothetical protein [Defluviitalea raffinosedens]HHW66605.1 S-layer homology domain-containing protein [Candidatus Epulonipiscium sp.]
MKKVASKTVAFLVMLAMAVTMLPTSIYASAFSDIKGHWAEETIQSWIDQGLIGGYPDGTFKPKQDITRAEFMSLVNGAFGYKEGTTINYGDVSEEAWYYQAVSVASAAGYIGGYPDNTMKPKNPITRQEVAKIVATIKGLTVDESGTNSFSDSLAMPAWSKGLIGAVVQEGFMSGYPDGSFKPSNNITRAEAVVTLNNALGAVKKEIQKESGVVYDAAGTYGSKDGIEVIENDVVVKASDVTLTDMTIKGNLTLAKEIGEGEVTLKNVKVEGTTYVYGGGENSIIIVNSTLGKVTVEKENGKIRLVVSGATTVGEVTAKSGVKLEESNLTKDGFTTVVIDASKEDQITLVGNFSEVEAASADINVNIPSGTVVNAIVLNAVANITGKGTVKEAVINVSGVKFEQEPDKLTVADNVEKPVITEKTTTGGGGGSSSSGNSDNKNPGSESNVPTIRITENTGIDSERRIISGNVIVDASNIRLINVEIRGNVIVNVPNVSIDFSDITGSLTITENAEDGWISANDLNVKGVTTIVGGGSIHFRDITTPSITVNNKDGRVSLSIAGDSKVDSIYIQSPTSIDTFALDVEAPEIVVEGTLLENEKVDFTGKFGRITVSTEAKIHLSAVTIKELVLNAVTEVSGEYEIDIEKVIVSSAADGSILGSRPKTVEGNASIAILELEADKYVDKVIIPNTIQKGENIENIVKQLKPNEIADRNITVDIIIDEQHRYYSHLENDNGTIRLKDQNIYDSSYADNPILRFTKGNITWDKEIFVTVEPQTYTARFEIKDVMTQKPLQGAEVTIDNQVYYTDKNGIVEMQLISGRKYGYTVTFPNYYAEGGSIYNTTDKEKLIFEYRSLLEKPEDIVTVNEYVYSAVYNLQDNTVIFRVDQDECLIKNNIFKPLGVNNYLVIVFDDYHYTNVADLANDILSIQYGAEVMSDVTDYVYGMTDNKVYVAVQLGTADEFEIDGGYTVEVKTSTGYGNRSIYLITQ